MGWGGPATGTLRGRAGQRRAAAGCRSPPRASEHSEHRDPRWGAGLPPQPRGTAARDASNSPGHRDLCGRQVPITPLASTVDPRVPRPVSVSRPPPRSSPWVPGTAPHPGIRALWSGRCLPRDPWGLTGDPRAPGMGGGMHLGFTPRGRGLTRGLLPQRRGTQRWPLREPRTLWPAPTALAVRREDGERMDVALDGACCPPRRVGRVDPATPGLPQNRLLLY